MGAPDTARHRSLVDIPAATWRFGWDMWCAEMQGGRGLATRRRNRLASLVEHARTASPVFRDLYRDLPASGWQLGDLPRTDKRQLMGEFDGWLTDPRFTRASVEDFVADTDAVGRPFIDGSFVCTSSGTSGHRGLFVHDQRAVAVQLALPYVRGFARWMGPVLTARVAGRGLREAAIVGTGGHFGGAAWIARARRGGRLAREALRLFPAQSPLTDLVRDLEDYDPTVVMGYPSALELLAGEQEAGRAHLRPLLVSTSGENLRDKTRAALTAAWSCPVFQVYAASECMYCAFECRERRLHLSSDWMILEPVDREGRPVPMGQMSHTVLLTNLANRLQPVIRYDLGDCVQALAGPCRCGSPLPGLQVAGRSGDVVYLRDERGTLTPLSPLSLGTVVDQVPGARRWQLVQRSPAQLDLHVEPVVGADAGEVAARAAETLSRYLVARHLTCRVEPTSSPPRSDPRSGKFRRIVPSADADPAG